MEKKLGKLLQWCEDREWLVLIIAFILLTGGWFYSVHLGMRIQYCDEEDYYLIARSLASKGIYSFNGQTPTAYRPPGYPFFLALFMMIGANLTFLRFVNFVALSSSIALFYLVLKRQSGPLAGLTGGILLFFYPVLFYAAGTLYPQTVGAFFFLLIIYLLIDSGKLPVGRSLPGGLLFGFLILLIPNFIFSLVLTVLWVGFYKKNVKAAFIVLFSAFLVIGFWSVRNYTIFKTFFFISTNSGLNLLLGNSENTKANSGADTDIGKYERETMAMDEVEQDAYYRTRAVEFILNNKTLTIKRYILKWVNYFGFSTGLKTQSEYSAWKDFIIFLTYGFLILLFGIRVFYYKRFPFQPFEIYIISLYFLNACFQAIFFTRIRFRLPFDYLLIAAVAIFIQRLYTSWKAKNGTG